MPIRLGRLHEQCLGSELAIMPSEVATAHVDLAAAYLGDGWEDLDVDLEWLSEKFPPDIAERPDLIAWFGGARLYAAWRAAMEKLLVESGDAIGEDPIRTLRLLGRSAGLTYGLTDLRRPLVAAFGKSVDPARITRDMAIEANRAAAGSDRPRLRAALFTLDRLRKLPAVRERGLLPPELIGPLPRYRRSGRQQHALPSRLREFCAQQRSSTVSAVKAAFEIGVDIALFGETEDPDPRQFVDPAVFTRLRDAMVAEYDGKTGRVFLNRLCKAVLDAHPDLHHPDPWVALMRSARQVAPQLRLDPLSHLRSRSDGRRPEDFDQAWLDELLSGETSRQKRNEIRGAARLIEELRLRGGTAISGLLPRTPLRAPHLRCRNR